MALLEKSLEVKRSSLPGSGKGLYTTIPIQKGALIVEYKGKRSSWNDADHEDGDNAYIFYINKKNVINASRYTSALARYANDAKGLSRVKGLSNNSSYYTKDNRVYIKATKDIPAGSEIFVQYGKDYWNVIRKNQKEKESIKK